MAFIQTIPDGYTHPLLMNVSMRGPFFSACRGAEFRAALNGQSTISKNLRCKEERFVNLSLDKISIDRLQWGSLTGLCHSCLTGLFPDDQGLFEIRYAEAVLMCLDRPENERVHYHRSSSDHSCHKEGCKRPVSFTVKGITDRTLCTMHTWEEAHQDVDRHALEQFCFDSAEVVQVADVLFRAAEWYKSTQKQPEPLWREKKAFPHAHYMKRPEGAQDPSTAFLQNPREVEMLDQDYRELAALGRASRYQSVNQERVALLTARCAKKGLLPFTPLTEPGHNG